MSDVSARSIRYRSLDDAQLQATIDRLVAQKHSGRASVDLNGQSVSFTSPAAIERMIQDLEGEVMKREAAASGQTTRRTWLHNPTLTSGKGYL